MEFIRIQIVVSLVIFSTYLTVHVHGKEENERREESGRDEIVADNLKAENLKVTDSLLVDQNEDQENRTHSVERDMRGEDARKNLEVQMKQMQETVHSLVNFKNDIENISRNYKNFSSSSMSIIVLNSLIGMERIVSNLTTKVSTLDENLLKLDKKINDIFNSSQLSEQNELLRDIEIFATNSGNLSEFAKTAEVLPRIQELEHKCTRCQNVMDINNTLSGYSSDLAELKLQLQEIENKADVSENKYSQPYVPCKEGWFLYGEKCYKFFRESKDWNESSENCSEEGGHLATISSNEVKEFINAFLLLNGRSNAWIGLNDIEIQFNFTWREGSNFSYTNWRPGEPSGKNRHAKKENCVETIFGNPYVSSPHELGYWNDVSCDAKMPYICQMDKSKGVKTLSPDPRFCSINEGGGFKYLESCYHIVRTKKSWEEAEKHCEENFSGHLVKILDKEVEIFLNYILSNVTKDFWIGIRRQDKIIQKWSSGWHVVHNRLNHDLKEFPTGTCVLRSKKLLWTTADCSLEFPFICERTKIQAPILRKAPEGWQCPKKSTEWLDLEGESCYIFGTNKTLNWYGSNYECARKGGILASITSKEEEMVLQHYVITHREVFIGLHRSLSNKQMFEWADGSRMEYTSWEPNEPNNEKEECGELYSNTNTWNDIDCERTKDRTYICSVKKVPPSTTESTASKPSDCVCPNGTEIIMKVSKGLHCPDLSEKWVDVDGDYYYIFVTNNSLRWNEAHYECGRKGGVLASIHSVQQTNMLRPYLRNSAQSVYIGLHRSLLNSDVFEWADGTEMEYQNWSRSRTRIGRGVAYPLSEIWPSANRKQDCVVMDTKSMKWNDINCSTSKEYICASKKVPSSKIGTTTSASSDCVCSNPSNP